MIKLKKKSFETQAILCLVKVRNGSSQRVWLDIKKTTLCCIMTQRYFLCYEKVPVCLVSLQVFIYYMTSYFSCRYRSDLINYEWQGYHTILLCTEYLWGSEYTGKMTKLLNWLLIIADGLM
jgi:hypothetical protein